MNFTLLLKLLTITYSQPKVECFRLTHNKMKTNKTEEKKNIDLQVSGRVNVQTIRKVFQLQSHMKLNFDENWINCRKIHGVNTKQYSSNCNKQQRFCSRPLFISNHHMPRQATYSLWFSHCQFGTHYERLAYGTTMPTNQQHLLCILHCMLIVVVVGLYSTLKKSSKFGENFV